MIYIVLLLSTGFLYFNKEKIIQNCFTLYVKSKIAWDNYFPKSTKHNLLSINYYDKEHNIIPINLTNIFNKELLNKGYILWNDIFDKLDLNTHEEARIEITYKIIDEQYKCLFKYEDKTKYPIKFPIYNEEDIINHQKSGKFKNNILNASIGDKDVTNLVKEYQGPLQDFHNNIGSNINPKWIIKDKEELEIIDSYANIHNIKNTDSHIILSNKLI
jgi:hypothetical protein